MTTIFAKMAIVYLSIGLFLTIAGGAFGTGINNPIADAFVNNTNPDAPVLTKALNNTFPSVDEDSSSTRPFGAFVDSIKAVGAFIGFIGTIFFALPMVLLDFNLPSIVLLAVGIPLTLGGIIGVVMFARSGN
jgi:hypothetical protein